MDWKDILLKPIDTLEKAIKVLHAGGMRITLVIDNSGKLMGTVTDGDIRKGLLNNISLSDPVDSISCF